MFAERKRSFRSAKNQRAQDCVSIIRENFGEPLGNAVPREIFLLCATILVPKLLTKGGIAQNP